MASRERGNESSGAQGAASRPGPDGGVLRVDLHTHTRYSLDGWMSPAVLVERAAEAGIDRIAVTDHAEIEGGLRARELDPERVIVGEEIRCRGRTELIGLFLREWVPPGRPLRETVERIRDQGGLVYLPHPFAYLTRPGLRVRRALEWADVLEVYNSRAFVPAWNRRAAALAERSGLPAAASSDAHLAREIGRAWTEVPAFASATGLVEALARGRPVGRTLGHPLLHVASAIRRLVPPGVGRRPEPAPADSRRRQRAGDEEAVGAGAVRGGPAIG